MGHDDPFEQRADLGCRVPDDLLQILCIESRSVLRLLVLQAFHQPAIETRRDVVAGEHRSQARHQRSQRKPGVGVEHAGGPRPMRAPRSRSARRKRAAAGDASGNTPQAALSTSELAGQPRRRSVAQPGASLFPARYKLQKFGPELETLLAAWDRIKETTHGQAGSITDEVFQQLPQTAYRYDRPGPRADDDDAAPMPTHEAIAQRAFELYLARGRSRRRRDVRLASCRNRASRGPDLSPSNLRAGLRSSFTCARRGMAVLSRFKPPVAHGNIMRYGYPYEDDNRDTRPAAE